MSSSADDAGLDDHHDREHVAKALRERLYVSIVGLSILLAMGRHDEHVSVGEVGATLTIGVVASVLAAVLAEVIAHISAHHRLPPIEEVLHIVRSASGALLVLVVPLGLFVLAGFGVIEADTALNAATWTIVISLGFITYVSIRSAELSRVAQAALLSMSVAFGAIVVGLQVLTHS